MGWLEPAQQRHIPQSSLNQTPFADAENEHPPSQFGDAAQQGLELSCQRNPPSDGLPSFVSCSTDSHFSAMETKIHDSIMDVTNISEQTCKHARFS